MIDASLEDFRMQPSDQSPNNPYPLSKIKREISLYVWALEDDGLFSEEQLAKEFCHLLVHTGHAASAEECLPLLPPTVVAALKKFLHQLRRKDYLHEIQPGLGCQLSPEELKELAENSRDAYALIDRIITECESK